MAITKKLAAEAKKLQAAYYSTFLVRDTEAWHEFCFKHSREIVEALKKASEKTK